MLCLLAFDDYETGDGERATCARRARRTAVALALTRASSGGAVGAGEGAERAAVPVSVSIDMHHPGKPVPRTFLGLSFELSSLRQIARYGDKGNLRGAAALAGAGRASLRRRVGRHAGRLDGPRHATARVGERDAGSRRPAQAGRARGAQRLADPAHDRPRPLRRPGGRARGGRGESGTGEPAGGNRAGQRAERLRATRPATGAVDVRRLQHGRWRPTGERSQRLRLASRWPVPTSPGRRCSSAGDGARRFARNRHCSPDTTIRSAVTTCPRRPSPDCSAPISVAWRGFRCVVFFRSRTPGRFRSAWTRRTRSPAAGGPGSATRSPRRCGRSTTSPRRWPPVWRASTFTAIRPTAAATHPCAHRASNA